jgi:hypothetical protein
MTLEEGLEVIRKCIQELHTRFLIAQPKFVVKVSQTGRSPYRLSPGKMVHHPLVRFVLV